MMIIMRSGASITFSSTIIIGCYCCFGLLLLLLLLLLMDVDVAIVDIAASVDIVARRRSLRDRPIQGNSILYLDNNPEFITTTTSSKNKWTLQLVVSSNDSDSDSDDSNGSISISKVMSATVPGDIITDLISNNWYNEPYYNNQFQNSSFCDMNSDEGESETSRYKQHLLWEYSIEFDISSLIIADHEDENEDNNDKNSDSSSTSTSTSTSSTTSYLLVFDGIKMGSQIYLNNQYLGTTTDQFLRYIYPLSLSYSTSTTTTTTSYTNSTNNSTHKKDILNKAGKSNKLVIRFDPSSNIILTNGRFSACSGGWDWAPYSNCPHTSDTNSKTYTFGITKSVYLVSSSNSVSVPASSATGLELKSKDSKLKSSNTTTTNSVVSVADGTGDGGADGTGGDGAGAAGAGTGTGTGTGTDGTASTVFITAIVPQIMYRGDYPILSLIDGEHDGFDVNIRVHFLMILSSPVVTNTRPVQVQAKGRLEVQGMWGSQTVISKIIQWDNNVSSESNSSSTEIEMNVTVSLVADSKDIKLWWPTGMGPTTATAAAMYDDDDDDDDENYDEIIRPSSVEELVLIKRQLYDIHVRFIPNTTADPKTNNSGIIQDTRRIGFRHFALVTGNDTDLNYVTNSYNKQGTEFHGMYYRINGIPIWSRGGNMIPMDILEGRYTIKGHIQLIKSAIYANMNTLRVWGGGIFLPKLWYDICDDYGILVIQDQMYAQNGHQPTEEKTQELEIRHNIRLLSEHPSIIIYDGCNECQVYMDDPNTSIYATFVMRIVAEEDYSRSIWPSCPGNGWTSGVDKLTSRPFRSSRQHHHHHQQQYQRQEPLITPNYNSSRHTIEVHGPYIHGGGFPAMNGNNHMKPIIDPQLPIQLDHIQEEHNKMGISYPSTFVSEFGVGGVMSSFESMSATLSRDNWSLHGGPNSTPDQCTDDNDYNKKCVGNNTMAQRNYPCDNVILAYFVDKPNEYFQHHPNRIKGSNHQIKKKFQQQLYHCMIGQALQVKSIIEKRKSKNELGHLVWQLNEIWPTGGWGSLEYGNHNLPQGGQVVGGRWKPLHYFYRSSLFRDVSATCGANGIGYIRNDSGERNFTGVVEMNVINIETGHTDSYYHKETNSDIYLPPGPGSLKRLNCPNNINGTTHFMSIDVFRYTTDGGGSGSVGAGAGAGADASSSGKQRRRRRRRTLESHNSPLLFSPPKDITTIWCDSGLDVNVLDYDGNKKIGTETEFETIEYYDQKILVPTIIQIEVTAIVPVALLVVLTTQAHGRFSDNAFTIIGGKIIIEFYPFDIDDDDDDDDDPIMPLEDTINLLKRTLRVEDMAMHQDNDKCRRKIGESSSSVW